MAWKVKCNIPKGFSRLTLAMNLSMKNHICSFPKRFFCSSHLQEFREELQKCPGGSVELTKDDDTGIAVITLNNSGKKNSLSGSMIVALADHVTELSQWTKGRGLIVRGTDATFCSGVDLSTVRVLLQPQDGLRLAVFMHDTLTRLHALPLVSLALLQGAALGGGAELATACDIRAMTPDARVGFVQVKMGVITGFGGGTRLVRLVGRTRALELLCSGRVIGGEEALHLGLVQHLLSGSDGALEQAQSLLNEIYCAGAAPLVRAIKSVVAVADNDGRTLEECLKEERDVFATVWGGDLQKAALAKNVKHTGAKTS